MNDLKTLQSMGLVLPSPAYLLGLVVFGLIGYAVFRRGRKTAQPTLTWTGVAMMLYPYAISQTWLLWAIGVAFCGWVYVAWK